MSSQGKAAVLEEAAGILWCDAGALLDQAAAPGSLWTLRLFTATTWPGRRLGAKTFWTKTRKTVRSRAPSTLSASIDAVAYRALGTPAILAGVALTSFSLHATTYGYGLVVMALAATTAIALWLSKCSPPNRFVGEPNKKLTFLTIYKFLPYTYFHRGSLS